MREQGLLSWQWSVYQQGHQDRRNLVIHVATVPVFMAGTVAVLASPVVGVAAAIGGIVAMVGAIAAQGRTHKLEQTPPEPFAGPLDVAGRIFAEQWITFPRYVASGGFARAWRESAPAVD